MISVPADAEDCWTSSVDGAVDGACPGATSEQAPTTRERESVSESPQEVWSHKTALNGKGGTKRRRHSKDTRDRWV